MKDPVSPSPSDPTRRDFLRRGAAAAAAGSILANTISASPLRVGVHSGRPKVLRVGLVGCGGRGGGAAINALRADPDTQLVAMGDAFMDRVDAKLSALKKQDVGDRVVVDADHCFAGFDAYQKVIDSSDVVVLASTPHFRPQHLAAVIDAGKHVFCEKPVATDPTGVRSVMDTVRKAEAKGLSLVSGLCWRYADTIRACMDHIHSGTIGDLSAIQVTYHASELWHRGDNPKWSRMEYQIRNWLYHTWLSGDIITEQHIHSLDKALWAMGDEPPKLAYGVGGRQVRTAEKYGNIYDHFAVCYEWENGVKAFSSCRQMNGCKNDVTDHFFGSKGSAHINWYNWRIKGEKKAASKKNKLSMYQKEHNELFRSIREGKPINNGDYMCKSTLMAILGRLTAYTGAQITWEQALNSKLDLRPERYEWTDIEAPKVALPGHTKFI